MGVYLKRKEKKASTRQRERFTSNKVNYTYTYTQWWSVTKYNYFVTVLKYIFQVSVLGVDRYVFFRADTDTDYYRSSRPITDILNRYTCLV